MKIIDNNVFLKNIKLEINDLLKIKIFNTIKTIKIEEIKIYGKSIIIKTSNNKEYINLTLINEKDIEIENKKEKRCNKPLIYLGGTCSGYKWRKEIDIEGYTYYNPLEHNWNEKTREEEKKIRKISTYNLYVFTKDISGYYAIASLIDDAHKYPEKTLLFIDKTQMNQKDKISLEYIEKLAYELNVHIFNSYTEINNYIKNVYKY